MCRRTPYSSQTSRKGSESTLIAAKSLRAHCFHRPSVVAMSLVKIASPHIIR